MVAFVVADAAHNTRFDPEIMFISTRLWFSLFFPYQSQNIFKHDW